MFIQHIITILELFLYINYSHSFRPPKHNLISYFKTMNNVYLENPNNPLSAYHIYVAGKTITVNIPRSVAKTSDVVNWKVINVDKDRLMFVHENRPQILIDQKTIKPMSLAYGNTLTGSIIAFGNNTALFIPTISNENLDQANQGWNYIELLYFDDLKEEIRVLDSLHLLYNDDWRFISEWKMTDYFHYQNKLYLLINRRMKPSPDKDTINEISIIRLCIDSGRKLIQSGIEIHYVSPLMGVSGNVIKDAFFQVPFKPNEIYDKIFLFIRVSTSSQQIFYYSHSIKDFGKLFDLGGRTCATGNDALTIHLSLLRNHLRDKIVKCREDLYVPCERDRNFIIAFNVNSYVNENLLNFTVVNQSINDEIEFFYYPFPLFIYRLVFWTYSNPYQSFMCVTVNLTKFNALSDCFQFFTPILRQQPFQWEKKTFLSQRPLLNFIVSETHGLFLVTVPVNCDYMKTCKDCNMFGLFFDCIWSGSKCIYDSQTKNKKELALNKCFQIINFSPSILYSSSSNILKIVLNEQLNVFEPLEHIVIKAGPNNYCDIVSRTKVIECIMRISESGEFKIEVHLISDAYPDLPMISAVSTDLVQIIVSDNKTRILLIIMTVVIVACLVLAYIAYKKGWFKKMKEFVDSKRSTESVESKISTESADLHKTPKNFVKSLTLYAQVVRPSKLFIANRRAKSNKPNRPTKNLNKSSS